MVGGVPKCGVDSSMTFELSKDSPAAENRFRGSETEAACLIYKCNKYPMKYLRRVWLSECREAPMEPHLFKGGNAVTHCGETTGYPQYLTKGSIPFPFRYPAPPSKLSVVC